MRLAYLGYPHLGGTYGVFRHLRSGLAPAGIEVRWLGAGPGAHEAFAAPCWASERPHGSVVGNPDGDGRSLGLAVLCAITQEGFDGVFVNVLTSRAEMNVARYLPAAITRIMIVHNITPGTYAAARAIRDYVHATVGVSPRIFRDLVGRHHFDPVRTFVIPNAVDQMALAGPRAPYDGKLRLIYLGRIEDAAKNVFLLPRILDGLDPGITLTVAGDGPDLPALRRRCSGLRNRIAFAGAVQPEQVPALLAVHDVLLMPSRFEGFGLTLVEAMASGCVPVATRLSGVTDAIVTDEHDGLLVSAGKVWAAQFAINRLAGDRVALRRLSDAARETARHYFSVEQMAARYRDVIASARTAPALPAEPLDAAAWRLPPRMRAGLRTYLPTRTKNFLRVMRERIT
ncbi:MAG: glycosyltransferase family 4 protein, partial [Acetobacteraceae bacterium]|nr:glycosyltransferase family 4 protein [Acetobacteraceae bacterium]